jgi:hypothetical protein
MTTAGARILNTELGLGRVGLALTRVGIAAGVLGPLITAAFPLLVVTAFVSIIDNIISKIEEMQDRAVDMDLAWQKIDHTILTFGDHLSKELDETDRKIAEVTGHSLTQFDNKIKETSVDADLLFQHINRVLTEFEDEAKKSDRGFLAQFITGKGGVREVIEEAKKAQESIQGALNKDDITGAMDATSKALDDITLRERELKSISGSEDRVASYEKLKTILEAYNVDLQRSVELAKDRTDLSVVETAAAAIREFDRGAKEDSRKSAEEELTAFDRMMELEKKGEEDLKRFSEETAREELEQIIRKEAAEKKAIEEKRKLDDEALRSALFSAKLETEFKDAQAQGELIRGRLTERELLDLKKKELDDELALEQSALARRIAQVNVNDPDAPATRAKLYSQLIQLQQRYQIQSQQISNQMAKINEAVLQKMTGDFNSAFTQWMNGSETFAKAMSGMAVKMADDFVLALLRMAEQMLINAALQKAITEGTKLDDAKLAASNTYASVSAIPIVGPFLAPPAAAAAFAAVLAFDKGGIVPSGAVGPVPIIAHAGEMVLPAPISSALQDAVQRGGATRSLGSITRSENEGGRSSENQFNFNIKAVDSKDVADFFDKHAGVVANSVLRHIRKRGISR